MGKIFEGVDLNKIADEAVKKTDESLKQEIKKLETIDLNEKQESVK